MWLVRLLRNSIETCGGCLLSKRDKDDFMEDGRATISLGCLCRYMSSNKNLHEHANQRARFDGSLFLVALMDQIVSDLSVLGHVSRWI